MTKYSKALLSLLALLLINMKTIIMASPVAMGSSKYCPKDTIKVGECGNWLGLVHEVVGQPPSSEQCCSLVEGLADLESAVCFCTVIKAANVVDVPVALSLLLNSCHKKLPQGFVCP